MKRNFKPHRRDEKKELDERLYHQHITAKKTARLLSAQGQSKWARHWEQYSGTLLQKALGNSSVGKVKCFQPPNLGVDNMILPKERPGCFQGVRH